MKTESIKFDQIDRKWFIVDAKNQTLGRLSSKVAQILRGKNKVNYTPHIDMSDFVVVINSDYINLSGNKEDTKKYWRHSGYPGGGRHTEYKTLKSNNSELILFNAVKGMLPSNKLSSKLIKHLKVYSGSNHPHESQKPETLEI
jgi:large subunit ribosomal protein L13